MSQVPSLYIEDSDRPHYDPQTSIRRLSRFALIALAIFFVILLGAAATVPIGGAVIGQGQVGVESRIKRIAHPGGGVITEVAVRDGMRVRRGQVLIRLDDTVTGTSADLFSRTVDQLLAQRARLMAEQAGFTTMPMPPELANRNDESAREAIAAERRLMVLRRNERTSLRTQLNERIAQLNRQIDGFQSQIAALRQQRSLIEPELAGVRELWDRNLVTIARKNQLERTAVELEGSVASIEAQISQTNARISETREQSLGVDQTARSRAGTELASVNTALNDQTTRSVAAGDQFERSVIRAPYDGVIDKLAFTTIGDVIQPAETIMEIVPDADRLVVEAAVSPTDIDRISAGQATRIMFTAFSAQTTPQIDGKVSFVAAERTTIDTTGASYYRVRIAIDEAAIKRERLQLKPGMPADVFISTGSRSMLSYVTKPIRDQLARAFRD